MHFFDHDLPEKRYFDLMLVFVVLIVLANVAYINYTQAKLLSLAKSSCGEECIGKLVDTKMTSWWDKLEQSRPKAASISVNEEPQTTPTGAKSNVAPAAKAKYLGYRAIGGGMGADNNWIDIGEKFFFDNDLYPEGVKITLEGWMENSEGVGIGSVRLYDVTNSRAVDGSEISINSKNRASFYTKQLSVWRGMNQYTLQVKSDTGYMVAITDARLKIER